MCGLANRYAIMTKKTSIDHTNTNTQRVKNNTGIATNNPNNSSIIYPQKHKRIIAPDSKEVKCYFLIIWMYSVLTRYYKVLQLP